jgi:hypothetical protein
MIRFLLTLIACMLFFSSTAQAEHAWHPSRIRVIAHGGHEISKHMRLEYRFIPSGNLIGELAPISYLGIKAEALRWLEIELEAGWAFKHNEPLISLTLNPHLNKLWGWIETDIQPQSQHGYWFLQTDYQVASWAHAGIEYESWGSYHGGSAWSHGAGPNFLLRFGTVGIDLAVHLRENSNEIKPEFFLRTHLFL